MEKIHGFASLREFESFVSFVEDKIDGGDFVELPADPSYCEGELYGGRWLTEASTGDICRLIAPDFPFKGLWEKVRRK